MARRLTVLIALVLGLLPAFLTAQAQPPATQARRSPEVVARDLQARYQSIRDFSADFVQSYRTGVLKTQTQERGTVAIKKPGKMRWTYMKPERKELVSDGVKLYWYVPEDKQVVVRDVANQASTPDLFLSGRGDIARDFTPSLLDTTATATLSLKLVPKRKEAEYQYLVLGVDLATLQLRSLTTRDYQGGESTLTFTNLRENRGLSDKDFEFRIPRGVKTVTN